MHRKSVGASPSAQFKLDKATPADTNSLPQVTPPIWSNIPIPILSVAVNSLKNLICVHCEQYINRMQALWVLQKHRIHNLKYFGNTVLKYVPFCGVMVGRYFRHFWHLRPTSFQTGGAAQLALLTLHIWRWLKWETA